MQKNRTVSKLEIEGGTITSPTPKQEESLINKESQTLIKEFTQYLIEDGKRPKTVESYIGDVTAFVGYIGQNGLEFNGNLKRFHITSYRNYLVESKYGAATINKKINSLLSFNHWLVDKEVVTDVVIDLRKDRVKVANGSENQVEVFQDKQIDRLLFFVQGEKMKVRAKGYRRL